jgi:hypothetical protein
VKNLVRLLLLTLGLSAAVFAQFPQMKRAEDRREKMIQADEERERDAKEQKSTQPARYPAVMNVDVQMTLAKLEYKTFAEAKPNAAARINDGDPLWLFVKFNGNLGRYIYTMHEADGHERYVLFVEYGPEGDVTAKGHYLLEFRKDELTLTELKMSLSPGKAGHNKALQLFIQNVGISRPGLWNNELRITNMPALPRGPNDHLAKIGFVCDFTKGIAKYPRMISEFRSMVLRDTTDETQLPIAGKFDDAAVHTELITMLAGQGIVPSKVYFSGDNWQEYSDVPMRVRQNRVITGTFLYQKGSGCFYGTADIVQTYDGMNDSFGNSTITLHKDIAIPCAAPTRMS